ncbi:MAG: hypothetical protein GX573_18980 [Chloroflexi bacterium]|nr:hypothetical protein [Chloroflexota bacterium]
MRVEIELRILPRFRVMDYLIQAGGTPTEALCVAGEGWSACIEALEPDPFGLVDVPRDRLVIEGDERAVERVRAFMQLKVQQMRRRR